MQATPENIAMVREYVAEADSAGGWTDERITTIIEVSTTLKEAAETIWRAKDASYAHLVDITEGGSSRKMSSLYTNALAMADSMRGDDIDSPGRRRPTTRPIVRPGWIL